jgi:predicted Zn-dependent protease
MKREAQQWTTMGVATVAALAVLWGGWKWWEYRRYKKAMADITADVDEARYGTAGRKLTELLAWRPDSAEALYLLGTCEMARGRAEAAAEAWSKVAPDTRFAPMAILGRMQLAMERGRLAEAEDIISEALADPRVDGSSLPILLGPIYCQQGRLDETLRLIETRWDALNRSGEGVTEPAIDLVRAHIDLRLLPVPVDVIRAALDHAGKLAEDDDRVWLGKANLAIREGSYDEAARWLDACQRRRPEDPAVWRARLDWAVASNRVREAEEALNHLPPGTLTPALVHRIAAWFADRRGDQEARRQALERLVAADSSDFPAMCILGEIAKTEGDSDRARELNRQKAETETLMHRYQYLHARNQPLRDAAELARLALRLGQRFEARAFLTLACHIDSDRADLRRELAQLTDSGSGIDKDAPQTDLRSPLTKRR